MAPPPWATTRPARRTAGRASRDGVAVVGVRAKPHEHDDGPFVRAARADVVARVALPRPCSSPPSEASRAPPRAGPAPWRVCPRRRTRRRRSRSEKGARGGGRADDPRGASRTVARRARAAAGAANARGATCAANIEARGGLRRNGSGMTSGRGSAGRGTTRVAGRPDAPRDVPRKESEAGWSPRTSRAGSARVLRSTESAQAPCGRDNCNKNKRGTRGRELHPGSGEKPLVVTGVMSQE